MMDIKTKAGSRNIVIRFSSALFRFVRWVSFGRLDMRYDIRTTTVGSTMYTGIGWAIKNTQARQREIRHEDKHVQQWKRYWLLYPVSYLCNVWTVAAAILLPIIGVGILPAAAILIGTLALPGGLSMRAYWEYQAFKITLSTLRYQGLDKGMARTMYAQHYTYLLCGMPYYYAATFVKPLVYRAWMRFLNNNCIGNI